MTFLFFLFRFDHPSDDLRVLQVSLVAIKTDRTLIDSHIVLNLAQSRSIHDNNQLVLTEVFAFHFACTPDTKYMPSGSAEEFAVLDQIPF